MRSNDFIVEQLETLDFTSVLEIGSGVGFLTGAILKSFAIDTYITCDNDLEMCDKLRANLFGLHSNLENYCVDFNRFNTGDKKFDIVIAAHVLEAMKDKDQIKILDKMLDTTKRYVIHTSTVDSNLKEYWTPKMEEWKVIGYRIDSIRVLFVAEKITP